MFAVMSQNVFFDKRRHTTQHLIHWYDNETAAIEVLPNTLQKWWYMLHDDW